MTRTPDASVVAAPRSPGPFLGLTRGQQHRMRRHDDRTRCGPPVHPTYDRRVPADPSPPSPTPDPGVESALPPTGARWLAFAAIVVAGVCGALIGFAVVDLQVEGNDGLWKGLGAIVGGAIAAGGVAIVAVLVLRAMGEWRIIEQTGDPAAARRRRPS